MVRLGAGLLALALAGPLAAECPVARMPQELLFQDGTVVTILGHTARDVTYRTHLPDGRLSAVTLRAGLFPMLQGLGGATAQFEWLTDLPDLRALKPGDRGHIEADMVVEHASRHSYSIDFKVVRQDVVAVQGCDYPVLVVDKGVILDGEPQAGMRLWIWPDRGLALKSESDAEGADRALQVTGFR